MRGFVERAAVLLLSVWLYAERVFNYAGLGLSILLLSGLFFPGFQSSFKNLILT